MNALAHTSGAAANIRQPPHSIEAEQAVLGGLMLSPNAWDRVADRIGEADFYRKDHRLIYRAIASLASRNVECDPVTLGEWFDSHNLADEIGGSATLIELANNTPSAANITAYADIVRDRAVLRELIDAATEIAGNGYQTAGRETQAILEDAEQRIFRISEAGARGKQGFQSIGDASKVATKMLFERYENQGSLSGLTTGFPDLDRLTTGLQPSDLVIVAGRPSMGKTALAIGIAEAAAVRNNSAVAIFSMEMSATQISFRLLSSLGRIDQQNIRTGNIDEDEWPRVTSAIRMLTDMRLYIDDTPALSPVDLRARARRLHREHGLNLIVVDYLQLMQVPGSKENRATEVSEISRTLKALAKELNVPVVALSQLNRSLEQRTDKRPVMADLRESGGIEQDADVIMFIYRDEYYNKDSPDKGLAEVIISKQRNGPTGTVKLAFLGKYTKFESYAPTHASYEGYTP